MLCIRSRGLLVWMALFCSLLLPVTAMGEIRGHQLEAIGCCLADCHADCCPMGAVHLSGCHGCSGSLSYLSPGGTTIYHQQATPHRLERITPIFKVLSADIFHPPELCLS